jgi:choline kinase
MKGNDVVNPEVDVQELAAETCALILAAGLGSRLGENTRECPKCLVRVAGTPILERMIDTLSQHGITSFIVAVGYLSDQIRRFAEEKYPGLDIRFVENPDYASTGSVYSLDLALDAMAPNRHVLLVEGDVVLEPALILRTLQGVGRGREAATLLAPYEPSLSGTFALVHGDLVSAWLHETVRAADFPVQSSFKTVNITFVRKGGPLVALRNTVKLTIATRGSKAPLEYAMQDLLVKGMQIGAVDTSGLRWFEVDTPEDLAIAESLFTRPGVPAERTRPAAGQSPSVA